MSLRFATATLDISPRRPVPLCGYARRRPRGETVADPLEANALVLASGEDRVLILSMDLLYVGPILSVRLDGVCRESLPPGAWLLAASHTHFAPSTDPGKPHLGPVDADYLEELGQELEGMVRRLLARNLEEGTLHYGEQWTEDAVNRRLLRARLGSPGSTRVYMAPSAAGPNDRTLRSLVVRGADGRSACVLWEYACHPVGFPFPGQVSADYPGVARAALRSALNPQAAILFLQGFSGDLRPRPGGRVRRPLERLRQWARPRFAGSDPVWWAAWSRAISDCAVEAARAALSSRPMDAAGGIGVHRAEVGLDRLIEGASPDRHLELCFIDLGHRIRLAGMSAEPVVGFLDSIRAVSPGRHVIPVGCVGDVFGYLPKENMLEQGGYEARGFLRHFGFTGRLRAGFEDHVKAALGSMVNASHGQGRPVYPRLALEGALRDLGLARDDVVLVRASLRALGRVDGDRAIVLLESLLGVVGEGGTLLILAFNPIHFLWPFRRPPVTIPETAPYTGGFANAALLWPGAVRSRHPTNSWIGIGRRAAEILGAHDERSTCFQPVGKLIELDGKMLAIGGLDGNPGFSTVHFAQEELGLATRSLLSGLQGVHWESEGATRVFRRRDVPGCSRGFDRLYPRYIRAGVLRSGFVGDAFSICANAREVYRIDREALSADPTSALCTDPGCFSCRATRLYNLRDLPGYCLSAGAGFLRGGRRKRT